MEHQWRVFPESGLQGTKLPILVAVVDDDGDDNTSEEMCCYCQIAKDGSMNYVL